MEAVPDGNVDPDFVLAWVRADIRLSERMIRVMGQMTLKTPVRAPGALPAPNEPISRG